MSDADAAASSSLSCRDRCRCANDGSAPRPPTVSVFVGGVTHAHRVTQRPTGNKRSSCGVDENNSLCNGNNAVTTRPPIGSNALFSINRHICQHSRHSVARNLIWVGGGGGVGVYVLTSHCNFKTYVNVPHVNKTVTDFGGIYTDIPPSLRP